MIMTEQLEINFGESNRFDRRSMGLARTALSNLSDPNHPWPEGEQEPYTQFMWDNMRRNAYIPQRLHSRITRSMQRGRVPFDGQIKIDEETGELYTHFELSDSLLRLSDFIVFNLHPKKSIARGKSGRGRRVFAPNTEMERVQIGFKSWAESAYPLPVCVYGLQEDRSYLDAAIAHAGNRYFYTVDIASAYESVDPQRLAVQLANTALSSVGPGGWFPLVRRFFIPEGQKKGLATGGNASPLLFNIYMRPLDEALQHYADAYGMTYTRYMDDMTFSAPDTGDPNFDRIGRGKAKFVMQAIRAMGMEVNDHKVRRKDLVIDGPVMLPGTQLDADGNWRIPERAVSNILKFFGEARHRLENHQLEDPIALCELIGEVHGIHSYIKHFTSRRPVNPDKYGIGYAGVEHADSEISLLSAYNSCRSVIARYNLSQTFSYR